MKGTTVKHVLAASRSAKSPVLIGLICVLPFAILELVFNPLTDLHALHLKHLTSLTFLFGLLWLLPTLWFAVLMSIVRTLRSGASIMAHPVLLLLRAIVLVIIAWAWGSLVSDQLPCFLGVPNCD